MATIAAALRDMGITKGDRIVGTSCPIPAVALCACVCRGEGGGGGGKGVY